MLTQPHIIPEGYKERQVFKNQVDVNFNSENSGLKWYCQYIEIYIFYDLCRDFPGILLKSIPESIRLAPAIVISEIAANLWFVQDLQCSMNADACYFVVSGILYWWLLPGWLCHSLIFEVH